MLKWIARLRRSDSPPKGFLGRLRRDVRGNTLAIVGAALVPLAAMIGSGVDMSRAYMAKTRLQSACDAAALAGRRAMQNDTMTTAVETEARRFFTANFNQGLYGTAAFTPVVTRPTAGTVRVTASTTIPTTIMRMFGFTSLPLNVTCDASLNFVNTDVMLVLDTTGSMLCTPEESGSCGRSSEISTSRIVALRDAVMALYDELAPIQTQLQANGMRLRYGVVPYSSSVNVGRLISGAVPVPPGGGLPGNPAYLRDSVDYHTWRANYTTNAGSDSGNVSETYGSSITSAQCAQYGSNVGYPTLNGSPQASGSGIVTTVTVTFRDWGATGDTSGTTRTCRRYRRTVVTGYRSAGQTYDEFSVDTSQFKLGNSVYVATDDDGGTATSTSNLNPVSAAATVGGVSRIATTWNGCIEERGTTDVITGSYSNPIPNNAFDLDVNRIPNNDQTRWSPMWPEVVHVWNTFPSTDRWERMSNMPGVGSPSSNPAYWACPREARRLQAWARTDLQTYVNSLIAVGGTYHDIGMIWGARMISNGGIFADSPDTFNGMPVARHIIFMTDGDLAPNCNTYTAYGVEQHNQRVTGSASCTDQEARHQIRFNMMCDAAKSLNASIWVIAFGNGTSLTQDLINCASNANQASLVANRAQLLARFREIGSQVGALRLTQ